MPNTLTPFIPAAFAALDTVMREPLGALMAVNRNATADQAAKNQVINSPVTSVGTLVPIVPSMQVASPLDQTVGNKTLQITNFDSYSFGYDAEEAFGFAQSGVMEQYMTDQISQAIRQLVNRAELSLCAGLALGASRAQGATPGVAPVLSDYSGAMKILTDNGAPLSDRSCVIDTTAGTALRNTPNLFRVNEADDSGALLRNGILGKLYRFDFRESAGISNAIAGTGTAYVTSGALTVGQTVVPLITGSGTILAGDIITFSGDPNKYVVGVGVAGPGSVTLNGNGIRLAATAGKTVLVIATSARNLAFHKNSAIFASRLPKAQNGDLALDRQVITDPLSGISFELSIWPGQRMLKFEVAWAWGFSVIKNEFISTVIG